MLLVVDAANVVGSRPTGWWRDRAGAAGRLVEDIEGAIAGGRVAAPVVVVLEGGARPGAEEGEYGGVTVVHAPADGDETVVAVTAGAGGPVTVVTADRALRDRCRALGAEVVGPGWLLDRLAAAPERQTGRLVTVRAPAPEAAAAVRAAWDAGEAVLVLDPRAPAAEVDTVLARVRPGEGVAADVAAVVVTSGTAGAPKGVELTWDGLAASAAAVSAALEVRPGDRWLACLPLHHVAGLAVLGRAWATRTPVTVLDGFDPAAVEAAATDATLVSLVPTMVRRLRQAGVDLGRFRRILLGGGPVHERGPNIVATYGMTETWGGVVHDGHPLAGVELSTGDAGEILVRAPMVMKGYRLAPEETAAAFTADGWFRTGDAGEIGPDGTLRVLDRLRDLVITGGVNVSPSEVEAVLAEHPAVADVCVAGAPDPEWGERVVAHVVPSDPFRPPQLDDLRAFAAGRLSAAKLPREVVVTGAIPRTAGGKPLRRLLQKDDD